MTFAETIQTRLDELGLKAGAVEKSAGLKPDTIRNVLRAQSSNGPFLSTAQEVCDALGLQLYVGPPRETAPIEHGLIDGADYAAIPRLDVTAAAGAGAANTVEDVISTLAFRRDWLSGRGIAASNAVLIRVMGDSMMPLIFDGDTVMVDTSRDVPAIRPRDAQGIRRSDIYALEQDGDTRIKWVERPDKDTLILYSENTVNFAPEILVGANAAAARIIGKVVWWGHTVS